jgi:hypothetical protein
MILFDLRQVSDQIDVLKLDPLRLLDELPAHKQRWEYEDPKQTSVSVPVMSCDR